MILPLTKTGLFKPSRLSDAEKIEIYANSCIDSIDLTELAYSIKHNIKEIPKCSCGNNLKFASWNKGYRKTCGNSLCQKESVKNTCIDKYGVSNVFLVKEVQDKIEQTCLLRHGTHHPAQSDLSKFNKSKTWRNNGGHPMQRNNDNIYLFHDRKNLSDILTETPNLLDICNKYSISYSFLCQKINENNLEFPINKVSIPQKEVYDYIKSLTNLEIKLNDRTLINPYEIDILVANKLAIEINGIYWHSYSRLETNEEKNYHLMKYELCSNAGLKFFSFTDVEWVEKREIIQSIIKSKLGLNDKIYARKTVIKELNIQQTKEFLEKNHLKGFCPSKISYGLYYNNDLVSVATFGKSRFSTKVDWELLRICFKSGINIIGGTSKLINHFFKNYSGTLISYSDIDKFDGSSYKSTGFDLVSKNPPSYYYWNKNGIKNRISMQKHKLHKILDHFDNQLTEAENCFNNGYRRYWNCGTLTWIKNSN